VKAANLELRKHGVLIFWKDKPDITA